MLVARGIMKGFKVTCKTERDAGNLAYSLRIRASRLESNPDARFTPKVKVDGRRIYVVGMPKRIPAQLPPERNT